MSHPYDCSTCGACCHVFIVDLSSHESCEIPEEHLDIDKHGHYIMRMKSRDSMGCGECSAHEGELGVSSRCTIYDVRSFTCRDYGERKGDCDRARTRAGLPIIKAVRAT